MRPRRRRGLACWVPVISPVLSAVAGTPTAMNRAMYQPGAVVSCGLFQHSAEISAKAASPQTAWVRAREMFAPGRDQEAAEHATDGLDTA